MKSLEMPIRQGGDGVSGKSIISNSYLEDIGDAIRYKKGSEDTYYPSQMGDAIRSIGGIVPAGTIEIDANGTYDVTEYVEAVVDVPDPIGTDLVTKYIGRNLSNGYGLFVLGDFSEKTGEIIEGSEEHAISPVYIPINPDYTYYKTDIGRFYKACLYDADYNFIGMSREQNNLSFREISPFPSNARYMRIRTHPKNNNWNIAIYRMA